MRTLLTFLCFLRIVRFLTIFFHIFQKKNSRCRNNFASAKKIQKLYIFNIDSQHIVVYTVLIK